MCFWLLPLSAECFLRLFYSGACGLGCVLHFFYMHGIWRFLVSLSSYYQLTNPNRLCRETRNFIGDFSFLFLYTSFIMQFYLKH